VTDIHRHRAQVGPCPGVETEIVVPGFTLAGIPGGKAVGVVPGHAEPGAAGGPGEIDPARSVAGIVTTASDFSPNPGCVLVAPGDDIDHAADGLAAIEGGSGSLDDLDSLYEVR
jgi:hypothetical protein